MKNLKVDDELHRALREIAAIEGRQLKNLVDDLLRQALKIRKYEVKR